MIILFIFPRTGYILYFKNIHIKLVHIMHIQLNYFIKVISHIRILVALSIHNVVQPPPISNSKPFSLPQNKDSDPMDMARHSSWGMCLNGDNFVDD